MSNQTTPRNDHQTEIRDDRREPDRPQSFRQKHGALLMLVGFGILIVMMVVMQKRMAG